MISHEVMRKSKLDWSLNIKKQFSFPIIYISFPPNLFPSQGFLHLTVCKISMVAVSLQPLNACLGWCPSHKWPRIYALGWKDNRCKCRHELVCVRNIQQLDSSSLRSEMMPLPSDLDCNAASKHCSWSPPSQSTARHRPLSQHNRSSPSTEQRPGERRCLR